MLPWGVGEGVWSTPIFRFRHPETLGLEADRPNLFTLLPQIRPTTGGWERSGEPDELLLALTAQGEEVTRHPGPRVA